MFRQHQILCENKEVIVYLFLYDQEIALRENKFVCDGYEFDGWLYNPNPAESDEDKIFDNKGNQLFDSQNGESFVFVAQKKGEYFFEILPYYKNGENVIYGDKIKLPSVLVEGKSNILDTDWWED